MTASVDPLQLRQALLAWYDRAGRELPWRVKGRAHSDPYAVWLSEIMCQQTQVATVIPYFERFLALWPTVWDLAAADRDQVLKAWAGLGYYARARNLHECARVVATDLGGWFPETESELKRLPGIGTYTAAAVAAICFGASAVPVDGNVVRVLSRFWADATPLPHLRSKIERDSKVFAHTERAGDFAQALMELGALICTPRKPDCAHCPWADQCAARMEGKPEAYPVKGVRTVKPTRFGIAFWAERDDGRVLITRRPDTGLLGGMPEFPGTDWGDTPPDLIDALFSAPVPATWQPMPGVVRHTFTHFHLELTVVRGSVTGNPATNGQWVAQAELEAIGLPTVMKKVARHVSDKAGDP